jgi:ubiquitin C-terminal hydrolase
LTLTCSDNDVNGPESESTRPLTSAEIAEGRTVEYALRRFTNFETLHGRNGYECERCCVPANKEAKKRVKVVDAQKKYLIYSFPPVLTLHLKRFEKASLCCLSG